jgi:hypothetical protein
MIAERPERPIVVGDVEIQTIARVVARVEHVGGAIVAFAQKDPVAIVVRSPEGTWRVELDLPSSKFEVPSS